MKSMAWRTILAGGALALAACGSDGAAGEERAPVVEVQGVVRGSTGGTALTRPSVGLVWARFDTVTGDPVLATDMAPLAGGDGSSFTLPVFAPPAADMVGAYDFDGDGSADLRIAFGSIFAFEDVDGDGAVALTETGLAAPDRIFGFSWENALVYVESIGNPDYLGTLFANPEDVVPGQLQLVHWRPCDFGLEIVPMSTSVVLWTFTPGVDVPEDAEPIADVECPGWPEEPGTGGVCGADPRSTACEVCLSDSFEACQTDTCGSESAAALACIDQNGCIDDTDACIRTNCEDEVDALTACLGTCTQWETCYTDAG